MNEETIPNLEGMAVIAVASAVKYFFVLKGMQTRPKGQYNAELTFSPRSWVKPLIAAITAIQICSPEKQLFNAILI